MPTWTIRAWLNSSNGPIRWIREGLADLKAVTEAIDGLSETEEILEIYVIKTL